MYCDEREPQARPAVSDDLHDRPNEFDRRLAEERVNGGSAALERDTEPSEPVAENLAELGCLE